MDYKEDLLQELREKDFLDGVFSKELKSKRYSVCKSCDKFTILKTCSDCDCFMPFKTLVVSAVCPNNKW